MIIEFLPKHSLNIGEDHEYIATYMLADTYEEAKQLNNVNNIRILTKGMKSGKERIFYLEKQLGFLGKDRFQMAFIDDDQINHLTPTHILNKAHHEVDGRNYTENFDYWKRGNNPKFVEIMLSAWVGSDPMIHNNGDMTHSFLSKQKNYKGSYKFNNKIY